MSYLYNTKTRKIKKIFNFFIWFFKFNWLNLSYKYKIILFWILLCIISLFLNWYTWEIIWNSFQKILWISWYLLLIIYIKQIFFLISKNIKQKFKKIFRIFLNDNVILLISSIFSFFITINLFFVIKWFVIFKTWIDIWNWIFLNLTWNIITIFWIILLIFEDNKTQVFTNQNDEDLIENYLTNKEELLIDKNNMKLPF